MKCETLSAQLAVLSACNSGRGQLEKAEGVVGLARALLARGVPTVVVALWPLPDSSTSTLMRTFYGLLCGEESVDVGDAMREAMRRTRDATPGEAHWGGLMVLGCGTVSLRVASSSCTTVVPEGVPPESGPELALEVELEPVLNLETVPQLELEVDVTQ